MSSPVDARTLLRHTLATVAYRASKALREAPEHFADFRVGPTSRTPAEILAHMGDLFDWALAMADEEHRWSDSEPLDWPREVERFFDCLSRFDARLEEPVGVPLEPLFQGPIADSLAHVGQLAMLRRLAGAPVRGENYSRARIRLGVTGEEQAPPVREFD